MNTWDTIVKLFLLAGLSFSQDIIGVIEYPPDPEERLLCGERCLNEQPPSAAFSCEQLASELGACDSSLVYGYCLCSCQKCPREGWYYINQNQSLSPSINTTLSTAAFESNFFDTQAIGLSVGGALDTESFRRSIDNNIVPLRSDITYEGVFNEYFFNISDDRQCNELVCAKYSAAVSKDRILNSTQMFLAVGFESGIQMDNFSRPDLNLVILLDTSLSMKYSFEREDEEEENGGSMRKIDVAKQAIQGMLGHLTPKDNFAVISFSHNSRTLVDFASGTKENIESANVKINRTWPFGGTNLEAALNASLEIIPQEEQSVRQNRLIVVTDANLNAGEISIDGLGDIIQQYSLRKNPIYTTIIGVGLDFNSTLVRRIQQNRGANYFTVSSPEQFVKKLDEEFEYIVTPLVFDLRLEFEDFSLYGEDGWTVVQVFGVPDKYGGIESMGTVVEISTLFPTPVSDQGTKGGMVLLWVKPNSDTPKRMYIKASYKDSNNRQYDFYDQISLFDPRKGQSEEFFGTTAIQKAILLVRYVDVIKRWLRISQPGEALTISEETSKEFKTVRAFIESQINETGDQSLQIEIDLLDQLIQVGS